VNLLGKSQVGKISRRAKRKLSFLQRELLQAAAKEAVFAARFKPSKLNLFSLLFLS